MIPISAMQIQALRALANGADGLAMHGCTVHGLRRRKLIELHVDGWKLTENGRAELAKHPLTQAVAAPLTRMEAIQEVMGERDFMFVALPPPVPPTVTDAMVEVCCDEFDAALQYHVIARSKTVAMTYIGYPGRYWSIAYCPFCGAKR